MNTILRKWLPLATALTLVCGLLYAAVQQTYRSGADDPQIQLAEDTAAQLDAGASLDALVPAAEVDLAESVAPFLLFFDQNGSVVAGNGLLDGALPAYPVGALETARANGENRVTWAPRPEVRIASVAVPYEDGYVVAGRSLREPEARVQNLTQLLFLGWIVSLVACFVVIWLSEAIFRE